MTGQWHYLLPGTVNDHSTNLDFTLMFPNARGVTGVLWEAGLCRESRTFWCHLNVQKTKLRVLSIEVSKEDHLLPETVLLLVLWKI